MPLNPKITDWQRQARLAGRRLDRHRRGAGAGTGATRRAPGAVGAQCRAQADGARPSRTPCCCPATPPTTASLARRPRSNCSRPGAASTWSSIWPATTCRCVPRASTWPWPRRWSRSISTVRCASPPPCCPTCAPGGGIAFVASVAGYRGLPKALAYGPGKAALIHFAECLYLDLAAAGHRRLGHQSRLRRDAADGEERFRHAGAADARAGRRRHAVDGFAQRAISRSTSRSASPAS